MDNPIRYAIRISHLSACFSSATFSHFNIAQKTTAVKSEDVPYTSPSTAENQKVSEKAYAIAPTSPLAKTAIICPLVISLFVEINFFARCVIVQKRNMIVKALARADRAFIILAASTLLPANKVATRAIIICKGAPGGWATSSL